MVRTRGMGKEKKEKEMIVLICPHIYSVATEMNSSRVTHLINCYQKREIKGGSKNKMLVRSHAGTVCGTTESLKHLPFTRIA